MIAFFYGLCFALLGWRLADREPINDIGCRHDEVDIPVIHLRGPHYQRGFQHGFLLRDELHQFQQRAWEYAIRIAPVRLEIPLWLALWITKPLLYVLAGSYVPRLTTDVRQELQGLSDGSDIDLRDVVVLNLIWEIFAMIPSQSSTPSPEHCSELAVSTQRSKGLFGYNYDVLVPSDRELIEGYMAVFIVRPAVGHAYTTPNAIGNIGINTAITESGLIFGWGNSYLAPDIPKGRNRTPYMLLLRAIALYATTYNDAIARFHQESRQEADMTTILTADYLGVIEIAGERIGERTAAITYMANRLQVLADLDYKQAGRAPDGRHRRYPDLIESLPDHVVIHDLVAIMRDTDTRYGRAIASSATTFTVLYDLSERVLWVSVRGCPSALQRLYAFNHDGTRRAELDIAEVLE